MGTLSDSESEARSAVFDRLLLVDCVYQFSVVTQEPEVVQKIKSWRKIRSIVVWLSDNASVWISV